MFGPLMINTWIAATAVAVIAGVMGFFAVLRGSTFAAHAIPNGAFAGAAGASLLGLNPFAGLAVFSVAGALGIAGLSRRARNDVATALTFVMMLAVGALFVSWSSQYAQEAYSLLFGEVFGVSAGEVLPILALGGVSVVAIVVMFRPLLFSSALPEVAEARGIPARRMELVFLLVMALATSMTVPVVGALLMFSLMIGPAAAARALTARPALAMALSVGIALVTVWAGIAASYQSDWPLGFFVGVIGAGFFLAGRAYAALTRSARRPGNTFRPAARSLRYLAHSRVPHWEQGRARSTDRDHPYTKGYLGLYVESISDATSTVGAEFGNFSAARL
jgi:zinc/manganese transport system permease protein